MYGLIPHALTRPNTCSELFQLAMVLFKSVRESNSVGLELSATVQRLSKLLLGYKPHEVGLLSIFLSVRLSNAHCTSQDIIQPGSIDLAAHGLVNMMHYMLCDTNDQTSADIIAPG